MKMNPAAERAMLNVWKLELAAAVAKNGGQATCPDCLQTAKTCLHRREWTFLYQRPQLGRSY